MKRVILLMLAVVSFAAAQIDMHVPRNIQSPYVAADFWTQWSSATPRMCVFVLVTPKAEFGGSSAAVGFTSNSRDMTLPGHAGITFKTATGITPSTIEMVLDDPTNLELTGFYQTLGFLQSDVTAGKWSFAEIEIFDACWDNVNLGEFLLFRGNLGDFKDRQLHFVAEGRGLIARLTNDVNMETSRFCRAPEFGDPVFCRKDLTGNVTIASVDYKITQTSIVTNSDFVDIVADSHFIFLKEANFSGNLPPDHFYRNGKITVNAGANSGVSREIADSASEGNGYQRITLKRPFPFALPGGGNSVTSTIIAGCDHTIEMCMLYDNIVNRRAEDFIPGIESANKVTTIMAS